MPRRRSAWLPRRDISESSSSSRDWHEHRLDRMAGDGCVSRIVLHEGAHRPAPCTGHRGRIVGVVWRADPFSPRDRREYSRRRRGGDLLAQEAFRFGFSSMSASGLLSGWNFTARSRSWTTLVTWASSIAPPRERVLKRAAELMESLRG